MLEWEKRTTLSMVASVFLASLALGALAIGAFGQSMSPVISSAPRDAGVLAPGASRDFVGSQACASCHATANKAWASSLHSRAMAAATPQTVRSDFSGAAIGVAGSRARFFHKDGGYFVETEGADGKPAIFAVSHTFGWEPLQQYLVTFPDGRLQALPWAWDTRPQEAGGQRWFHVYGKEPIPVSDPRHWTRYQQNWNHMCAECHSTAVSKGYDPAADVFRTTWSEISVGCEGCHGAAGGHVTWAIKGADRSVANKGFSSVAAKRPAIDWTPDAATGSPKVEVARPAGDEVETCARCHSRRGQISADWRPGHPLGDTHLPAFLTPDLFEDDGQMKDEVFNDHSFKQSLMYARGVICSDCHDVHSGQLKSDGAGVCNQCHLPERFSTTAHSGHRQGKGAPDCIACHMPARTYMQVDRRHDHSFRIPRPDLSVTLGTPNACTDCHQNQTAGWAAAAVEKWHGPTRKGHQTYAEALRLARTGDPAARALLQRIATGRSVPGVARASAVLSLASFPSKDADAVIVAALSDPEPLARVAALRGLGPQSSDVRLRRALPALSDPVRIVRLEAAALLADQNPQQLPSDDRERLLAAFREYEAAERLDADRPEGRARLALFFERRRRLAEAETEYLAALKLEPEAATIAVNLSDLYRVQGREAEAEKQLREALDRSPSAAIVHHALGLSLIRSKRLDEALEHLRIATEQDPSAPRFAYVYAIALQSTGRQSDAEAILQSALSRSPYDADILGAALQRALRQRDLAGAAPLASRLSQLRPDDLNLAQLAARLNQSR
jgi:Flp pilus assembly protein TadD